MLRARCAAVGGGVAGWRAGGGGRGEGRRGESPQPCARPEAAPAPLAQLPKNLEIRPDDSEEVAAKKKKKLNMFKRQEKKARTKKKTPAGLG